MPGPLSLPTDYSRSLGPLFLPIDYNRSLQPLCETPRCTSDYLQHGCGNTGGETGPHHTLGFVLYRKHVITQLLGCEITNGDIFSWAGEEIKKTVPAF